MKNIPVRHINTSPKETNGFESFSIRAVRDLLAGKDMIQELHRHDYYYILVLESGAGEHEIDFIPYQVRDHVVFFMRPGQVHQLILKRGSTGFLMEFKTDFYTAIDKASGQLLRRASNKNYCHSNAKGVKKLVTILTSIFDESRSRKEGYQEIIKANLAIFFIELIRNRQSENGPSSHAKSYAQERLEIFLGLLETQISNHIKASQYAELLHLSTYQLNAITKATLGRTPSELINEHIILESKRHLLATSNQVNQIAYDLGYEDVSYFIRFFKKHTGFSPEAFRQNFK